MMQPATCLEVWASGKNLIEVADNESASEIRMVYAERAEFLWPIPLSSYRLRQLKIPEDTFKAVRLVRSGEGWLSCWPPTSAPPDIAEKVRQALSSLQQ